MQTSLPIEIISASAGSGKTYTLSKTLVEALRNGVRPEAVLATTFTNKAAAELVERVRADLFKDQKWEYAQRIFDGHLGTVNSVCGRLLKEFAFELGLSPVQDVLPEEDNFFIFERAIAPVSEKYSQEIDAIANRFEIKDWRDILKDIINKVRTNDIAPDSLSKSYEWSWKTFQDILPATSKSKEDLLDKDLADAISETYESLKENRADSTVATKGVIKKLGNHLRSRTETSSMPWPDWARFSKLSPGAKSRDLCERLTNAAKIHTSHPRLQRDIQTFVRLLFECAREAVVAFSEFKEKNGIVDFVDQEKLALELLRIPEVQERLKEDLKIVFVDEFQDTSPIQLALFIQFARLASKSVWVGDQKQAIYGFRGTDPTLMDAVIDQIIDPKRLRILSGSYRSRPGLIAFTNNLFATAFEPLGIPPDRVRLEPKLEDGPGQKTPLLVWRLSRKDSTIEKDKASDDKETRSLAVAVGNLLEQCDEYMILDKNTKQTRPLRPADIAILCRRNSKCEKVATLLEAHGIRASIPRSGLMSTPECILGFAALRYLVDKSDSLAVAEILHFTESSSVTPKWFTERLENLGNKIWNSSPTMQELDRLRGDLIHLTPSEALETALNAVRIHEAALRWGNTAQRIANLEMLKGLALNYEDQCLISRSAGTPAGLVTFLSKNVRGEEIDTQPAGQDDNAVKVLTYHSAKGLEWPVVVMYELDWRRDVSPFGAYVESEKEGFDPMQPLAGRRVRYWPWPYATHKSDVGMDDSVRKSSEYKQVALQERKELMRLLYVGMTRARDYLAFAVGVDKEGKNSARWLEILEDKENKKILSLPLDFDNQNISVGGQKFAATLQKFEPFQEKVENTGEATYTTPVTHKNIEHPRSRLVPSQLGTDLGDSVTICETVSLGERIPLDGNPDMDLVGEAIHGFLAVDDYLLEDVKRMEMAEQTLLNWRVTAIKPENLVEVSNRLRSHIEKTYGKDCIWRSEWPIHLRKGNQKANGWIDLLLETPAGIVIIDHKSFPGSKDRRQERALSHAPQLALYREAVEKATGKSVIATIIHMPVVGEVMEIRIDT
jgi:ATP-dependent exoDNAse (exonuclease V) beta subunit